MMKEIIIGLILVSVLVLVFIVIKKKKEMDYVIEGQVTKGTYRLVQTVNNGDIIFTNEEDIPNHLLATIKNELKAILPNKTPYAATSLGSLTLYFESNEIVVLETIYNMGKHKYEPIIYIENKQYYISQAFENIINELSKQ